MEYKIEPIRLEDWLPDRCLTSGEPIDPSAICPEAGCHSLNGFYTEGRRSKLIALYQQILDSVGCCGFVAWVGHRIVGYNNFFSYEVAKAIKFYGWGVKQNNIPSALVHHCISVVDNPEYRRKGIGTSLIKHSLDWASNQGWNRFEVHLVLPDHPAGFNQEQKSCHAFWNKFGF